MAVLGACGGGGGGDGDRVLGKAFADGVSSPPVLVAGVPQRAPLVLFEGGIPMRDKPPATIDVELYRGGTKLSSQTVARHAVDIPTPYYPFRFTPDAPGDYEIRAAFSELPVQFRVVSRDKVPLVQIGDKLRPVDTPTVADPKGVNPICTRTPQLCPLHDVTLTEVLKTPGPVAFLIATPGYCQTAVCGPVLELLLAERAKRPTMRFVHADVYVDPQEFASGRPNPRVTAAVSTYGLSYEPSLIVARADGTVTDRLDFTWDSAELKTALDSAA